MTTYSWKNAASADWSTAADWIGAGAPPNSATADAFIAAGGSYTVTIATTENILVDSLSVAPSGGKGTLAINGTLTLGGSQAAMTESAGTVDLAGTITGGTLTLSAGVLADTGAGTIASAVMLNGGTVTIASGQLLTLSGAVTLSNAEVLGAGTATPGATLDTTGTTTISSTVSLDNAVTWVNAGTVLDGYYIYAGYNSASKENLTVNNTSAGTFDITAGGYYVFYNPSGNNDTTTFTNAGLLEMTAIGEAYFFALLVNTGSLAVNNTSKSGGTLDLGGGGALGGTATIGATDALILGGTAFVVAGNIANSGNVTLAATTVTLSGSIANSGTVTITGGAAISASQSLGGAVAVSSGTVAIASGQVLMLSGAVTLSNAEVLGAGTATPGATLDTTGTTTISSTVSLDNGVTWVNAGTVLDGYYIYAGYNSASKENLTVNNTSAGTFDITAGGYYVFYNPSGNNDTTTFTNTGLLEMTATGEAYFYAVLVNTGSLAVNSPLKAGGTLDLVGGGTLGGTVTIGATDTLLLSGAADTLTASFANSGTLTISNTVTLTASTSFSGAGTLVVSNGSLAIASGVTAVLAGAVTLSGAEVLGAGTATPAATLDTTGTTTISSTVSLDNAVTWVNAGTVLDGYYIYAGYNSASKENLAVNNTSAGTFDITAGGYYVFYNPSGNNDTTTFTNTGLLEMTATGEAYFYAVLVNTGLLAVNSPLKAGGSLDLAGGGTLGGTVTIGATDTLLLSGAADTLTASFANSGTLTISNTVTLTAGASFSGAGTLVVSNGSLAIASGVTAVLAGAVTLSGAEVLGAGTATPAATLDTTGTTTISSTVSLDNGVTWVNAGTVLDGYYIYAGYNSASKENLTVNNTSAGTFDIAAGGYYVFYNPSGNNDTTTFTNAGLLEMTATGEAYFYAVLVNTGALAVNSPLKAGGTLDLAGGGALGGSITIGATDTLLLSGAADTLTASFANSGTLTISNTVTLTAGASFSGGGSLVVSSGTLAIASGVIAPLASAVSLYYAEVLGAGTATPAATLDTTGTTSITGNLSLDNGVTWVNSGTVLDGYYIYAGYNSASKENLAVNNTSAGTFDITVGNSWQAFYNPGSNNDITTYTNAGLLEMTATGVAYFDAVLVSSGTVTATAGTLDLAGGGTLGGSIGAAGSGFVLLNSNFTTGATASILDDGGVNGLQLAASQTWTDSGVIDASGRLLLNSSSDLAITAAGTFAFTADDGAIAGSGTGIVLSNAGTIAKIAGSGTSSIAVNFANSGTVDVASGTLKLGGVSGSGQLRIAAGKTLELASGAAAGGSTIDFAGFGATLKLDASSSVSKPIIGLGAGSRIDLAAAGSGATAVISGNTLTLSPSGGSAITLVGAGSLANLHIGTASDGGTGTVVTLYGVATPSAHTPEPVAFGSVHQGAVAAQTVTLGNTGSGGASYGESLKIALSASNPGFTAAGSTEIADGSNSGAALAVTLNTANTGSISGTATLTLQSDGGPVSDGFGLTSLPSQTVNVTAAVYAYAAPVLSTTVLNFGAVRVGGVAPGSTLTLADGSAASLYQESLVYGTGSLPAGFSGGGSGGTIVAGGSVTLGFLLATGTAGDFTGSALALNLTSTGAGTSGLADTPLTPATLTLNGQVYATATASLGATVVEFGVVHTGQSVASILLGITNTASGALTDVLQSGSSRESGSYTGSVTGLAAALAAGQSGSVSFALATGSAGVQSGTVDLGFTSFDAALGGLALSPAAVTVTGTVDNYATASFEALSGQTIIQTGAESYAIKLGPLLLGSAAQSISLEVLNSATGQADQLAGSFSAHAGTGFSNSGFAAFSNIAAGLAFTGETIKFITGSSGAFIDTITLDPSSTNVSSSTTLTPVTLTVSGFVGGLYTLTTGTDTFKPTIGADTFIASDGALSVGDVIAGGAGGPSILKLTGGGSFDLSAPAQLTGITTVYAAQGHAAGGGQANSEQDVTLRGGLNVTLDVAAGTANAANPDPLAILIQGAADSSTINLASGQDTVVLGSSTEKVVGAAGGTALVQASAGFANAAVAGKSGAHTTLEVTTGGTIALNAATSFATIQLEQASSLTLNRMGFISAIGETSGTTIVAGAANQTLESSAGGDTLTGYAKFGDLFAGLTGGLNGDTIKEFGGSDKFDFLDLAPTLTPTYTGTTTQGTLSLSDGIHTASLTMIGDFIAAGHGFHIIGDGHAGSYVTYS